MYVLCRADGDCLMLAQAMDLPTSVRLARTKAVDMRLFRHTPRLPPTDVRIFLSMLAFEQHYFSTIVMLYLFVLLAHTTVEKAGSSGFHVVC